MYSVFLWQFLTSPTLLYNNNLLAHWKSSYQIKVSTSFEVVGPRSDSCSNYLLLLNQLMQFTMCKCGKIPMGKQPPYIKQPRGIQPSVLFYVVKLKIGATRCVAWSTEQELTQMSKINILQSKAYFSPTPSIPHRPAIQILESGLLNYQCRPKSTYCSYWVFTVVRSQDRKPQSKIPEVSVGINYALSKLFDICDKNVPFLRAQTRA